MTQQEKQVNYMGPFITMVFLFFIVGFLTTANTQFQGPLKETFLAEVGGLKNTFATLITFSWFLAYPVCGRVGSSWISKYGYKGTLMRGLLVMVVGLGYFSASSYFTVFFPEANWHAGGNVIPGGFFIFLLGSFVVGASATILQVVINPYLTACHVKGTQASTSCHWWLSQFCRNHFGTLFCYGCCFRWLGNGRYPDRSVNDSVPGADSGDFFDCFPVNETIFAGYTGNSDRER